MLWNLAYSLASYEVIDRSGIIIYIEDFAGLLDSY